MADLDGFLLRRTSPEGQSFRSHTVSESWRKDDQSRSGEGHQPDEDYENVRQTVAVVSCCSVHTSPEVQLLKNIVQVCHAGCGKRGTVPATFVCLFSTLCQTTVFLFPFFADAWVSVDSSTCCVSPCRCSYQPPCTSKQQRPALWKSMFSHLQFLESPPCTSCSCAAFPPPSVKNVLSAILVPLIFFFFFSFSLLETLF